MAEQMTVVSLVPSVTETLIAWGIEPVACTRFCERPEIENVGGTKDPDVEAITALAPDLVIVDREENRLEDYQYLLGRDLTVKALHVTSLSDVSSQLAQLASIFDVEWNYSPGPPKASRNLTAFVPIWKRPWMTIGSRTYGVSLLEHLGVEVLFSRSNESYPTLTDEVVSTLSPDIVLAPSEPYPFGKRHLKDLELIAPTFFIDGQDLFWWGSRTADAIQRLDAQIKTISQKDF
jgi:ABC-type Fe3+-hydroxamate transport system substrate-binding protein